MKLLHKQRGQVLILIFGAMFIGGGLAVGVVASGETLKALKKDIKALQLADEREDQALAILSRWKKVAKPIGKSRAKRSKEIVGLLKNQYTTADTITELFAAQTNEITDAEAQVLALRDELRGVLSKSEWERVFAD